MKWNMLSFHIFLFFLSDSSDGFFRVIRSGLFERSNSLKQGKKLLSTVSEFNIHKVKMLKEMYKLLIEHFELICCNFALISYTSVERYRFKSAFMDENKCYSQNDIP